VYGQGGGVCWVGEEGKTCEFVVGGGGGGGGGAPGVS